MIYFSIFNCQVSISWVRAGCQRIFTMAKQFQQGAIEQDENFGQNAKQNKIREKETRMIYLCSTESKRLADGCSLHQSASLSFCWVSSPEQEMQSLPLLPSPSQRYNTLDFASKVVCHETPARFLWILPAATGGKRFFAHCRAATP